MPRPKAPAARWRSEEFWPGNPARSKICPAEPKRERTISKSVNALLLESAQNIDEAANPAAGPESVEEADHRKTIWKLALLTREGAEFVVVTSPDRQHEVDSWGTQCAGQLSGWTRRVTEVAKRLSDRLEAGPLLYVAGSSLERQVLLLPRDEKSYSGRLAAGCASPTNCLKRPRNWWHHGILKTNF